MGMQMKRIKAKIRWVDTGCKQEVECMIGQYDGISNDDDIFYWFADENEVNDNMNNGGTVGQSAPDFIVESWEVCNNL